MIVLLAAHVWTYWMAPPLFAAAVLLDLTIAVLYFKRFVLPRLVVKMMDGDQVVHHPVQLRPLPVRHREETQPHSSAA
jgi:hypothetical protein